MTQYQAVTELLSHEDVRSTFHTLRTHLKPLHRSQLKTLWVATDDEGNYIKDHEHKQIYSDEKQIHAQLLRRNEEHLTQASVTPFAKGTLRKKLKWDSTGVLTDDILSGNLLNQRRFSAAMQLYLESLRVKDISRLNIVRPDILLEDYRQFWKKKRETTVTSPYGLHTGHYKASVHKLAILNVHRILLLIPFKTGMVPSRWRRTVQTMLEKEPGAPWIHRLRIIELFDAQANAGFQIFVGRHLMGHAVKHDLLQDESFGSTPGKMATSAVVQKVLAIDQLRIERRAGGIFDCDASGCYDRILPPLASVHLQALGLHRAIGIFLARLMFQARRHVRTHHGVSKDSIVTTRNKTLHGIGQGNGGGPAMWIAHLTVMFAALSSVCTGFALTCIQKLSQVCTVGTCYVDDVTLGVSIPHDQPQTDSQVYHHLRRMGQLWEKLLYITGGRLELTKCFWVTISWTWHKGIPRIARSRARYKQLVLKESETGDHIPIPVKTCAEAVKRLGIWSTCNGTWNKEVRLWIAHSRDFSKRVKGAGLSRVAGYLAYQAVWLAKFRYSAAVVGYSVTQLSAIQSSVIGSCLSASGFSAKMPRAVVYGPQEYGGMAWDNVLVLSLYEKIKMLVGSIRLQDKVGGMLQIQLSWLQLFAGIGTPLLQYHNAIPFLPSGWLTNVTHLLVETGVQIEFSSGWIPTPQRVEDRLIMELVLKYLPSQTWECIKRCRLFLQATTVADLVSVDGTYIPRGVRELHGRLRDSHLLFPEQRRPPKKEVEQWTQFLQLISENGHLFLNLGPWIRQPDQYFPYLCNREHTKVYKHSDNQWMVFGITKARAKRFQFINLTVTTLPPNCFPVRVIDTASYLLVLDGQYGSGREQPTTETIYQKRQRQVVRQVLGTYTIDEQQEQLLKHAWGTQGLELVCATDGGLKDLKGTV